MPDRYKSEIEEILQQVGELRSVPKQSNRFLKILKFVYLHFIASLGGKSLAITPGRILLGSLLLFLMAIVLQVGFLAWSGLILFIIAYAMFFIRPPKIEKRWRGQIIDDGSNSWWDRFK
tara:strand:+ start:192 stop:548 length:357 start_codon:yes stop_codon:yes gene_type:complete